MLFAIFLPAVCYACPAVGPSTGSSLFFPHSPMPWLQATCSASKYRLYAPSCVTCRATCSVSVSRCPRLALCIYTYAPISPAGFAEEPT
ncbi:hypothetical protein EDB83DRAFT_2428728 [Lactarius deliciosus]|nr:hypothetical protein EDB83DRAFT_2428728 [Lactarius deliciosus]